MDHFLAVDPSGRYLEFVRQAKNGKGELIWVWGTGNNGKSGLYSGIREAFPKGAFVSLLDHVCNGLFQVQPFVVKMEDDPELSAEIIQINMTKYQLLFPQISFIVEANRPPPEGLDCEMIHCPNIFNDRFFRPDLEAIREVIAN